MKLEELCISLDLAKRLKELNVSQESYFYYCYSKRSEKYYVHTKQEYSNYNKQEDFLTIDYSAFTSGELGELLQNKGFNLSPPCKKNETEADTRAKLLITLIESGCPDVVKDE